MGDTSTLFRLVIACALVGLTAYCIAHVVNVWRKRNAKKTSDAPATSSFAKRFSILTFSLGLTLIVSAVILRELTHTEGMLAGEDLYVVRAFDDMTVDWLRDGNQVAAGEPLARFASGTRAARGEELRARLIRAEAERDVLALQPLAPDPELTRRHQAIVQERAQVQLELGQARTSGEAADRDINAQLSSKKEAIARLERSLTERRKDLERATIRCAHARKLATDYADLRARGTITVAEYREYEKAVRDADVEVASLSQELKDGLAEKSLLQTNLEKLEANSSDPKSPIRAQITALTTRLVSLEANEKELKNKLDLDQARAAKLRQAEIAQADAKISEHKASISGLAVEQEIRAPFAGRIAYRAPSPNAVRSRGTLLVMGPENGFRLTARLSRAEAAALRDAGDAVVDVGDESPQRHIPARFFKMAALDHEPDQTAMQLECQPPPEVVRRLADGEKLTVAFAWHPPLTGMWPFRIGVGLSVVGLIGILLGGRQIKNRSVVAVRVDPILDDDSVLTEAVAAVDGRAVQERILPAFAEIPDSLETLEAACRESIEQLNRAQSPDEAAKLLARLHKLRRALRDIDLPRVNGHLPGDSRSSVGAAK